MEFYKSLLLDKWDILLMIVVVIQSTILASLQHPRWKAFMITLPFPFTVAVLAVGKPIDTTNILGLLLLMVFTHGVRIFHNKFKFHIIAAILASTIAYCLLAKLLGNFVVQSNLSFYVSTALVYAVAISAIYLFPHKHEQGQKSLMPIRAKLFVIIAVVYCIMLMKKSLTGFVTVFPMVGVIAAYESKSTLWTLCRQVPTVLLTLGAMIAAIFILQNIIGLYFALAAGWVVFLIALTPFFRHQLKNSEHPVDDIKPEPDFQLDS